VVVMSIENVTGLPNTPNRQAANSAKDNVETSEIALDSSSVSPRVPTDNVNRMEDLNLNRATETEDKSSSVTQQELQKAVDRLKDHVQNLDREFQFNVDKETGDIVVKVVNPENNQVVRQIPSEELLELVKRLEENKGLLLRETV